MADVFFVAPEDVDVLRKYLSSSSGDVVLIYPSVHAQAAKAGLEDDVEIDYDYGGDPDVRVEIVASPTHYLLDSIANEDSEE
jgi:hypothetical protein